MLVDAERVKAAMAFLLQSRGLRHDDAAGLARRLKEARCFINPNTLRCWIRGDRPARTSKLQEILDGLRATDTERALFWRACGVSVPKSRRVLQVRDALVAETDRGREREHVTWMYRIGADNSGDRCVERRRTYAGSGGLRAVSFGPGQLGKLQGEDLLNHVAQMNLRVEQVVRVSEPSRLIPASLSLLELDTSSNKCHIVVRFTEAFVNEEIDWTVSYAWPGLWHSLRVDGKSSGRLRMSLANPKVVYNEVVIDAPAERFPELRIVPQELSASPIRGLLKADRLVATWGVKNPPELLQFQVLNTPDEKTEA